MEKININQKLALFHDFWNPHIIGELNGQHVKVVKVKGEFMWHHHDHEDELFYVIRGNLTMAFRDKTEIIGPGEMIVVPRGVEHKPMSEDEVHLILFEPSTTRNTGNLQNELTRNDLTKI